MRGLVRQLDSRVAVAEVTTMSQVLDAKMAEPLRLRFFLGLFALLGVVLGTVGVYGVVSYGVSRQQRELGVRMALGATPWEVWREVIGKGSGSGRSRYTVRHRVVLGPRPRTSSLLIRSRALRSDQLCSCRRGFASRWCIGRFGARLACQPSRSIERTARRIDLQTQEPYLLPPGS